MAQTEDSEIDFFLWTWDANSLFSKESFVKGVQYQATYIHAAASYEVYIELLRGDNELCPACFVLFAQISAAYLLKTISLYNFILPKLV